MSQLLAFDIGAVIGSTFFVVHIVDENNINGINGVHFIFLTIVIRYFKLNTLEVQLTLIVKSKISFIARLLVLTFIYIE